MVGINIELWINVTLKAEAIVVLNENNKKSVDNSMLGLGPGSLCLVKSHICWCSCGFCSGELDLWIVGSEATTRVFQCGMPSSAFNILKMKYKCRWCRNDCWGNNHLN